MSVPIEAEVNPAGSVSLSDYLGVFSRRGWIIAVPFLLMLAGATTLAFLLPPQYEANTRVKVEQLGFLEKFYERTGFNVPARPFLATIQEEVRRRSFLEELIRQQGITEGFDWNDRRERQRLFEHVIENLEVTYSPNKNGSDIFGFTYTGQEAPRVARFVNAIRQKYQEYIQRKIVNVVSQAKTNAMARMREAERLFDRANDAIRRFESRGDFSLSDAKAFGEKAKQLEDARSQMQEDQIRLKGKEADLDQVRHQLRLTQPMMVEEMEEQNPEYLKAVAAVSAYKNGLKQLKEDYTDLHPKVKKTKEALERAQDYLALVPEFLPKQRTPQQNPVWTELEAERIRLQREVSTLDAEVKRRKALITKLSTAVDRIPDVRRELERLQLARTTAAESLRRHKRTLDTAESTYERVISKENSIFTVLVSPTPGEARNWEPVFPNVGLFIGAGALVGLLLGVGLAFVTEFSNQSYVSAAQARRLLPVPFLGQVDEITTENDRRRRVRRRLVIGGVVGATALLLVLIHVAYFNQGLQENLPTWLFDFMKRIYGSR